ncbi:TRAP transporter substrate-binding protein [Sporomusa sp.]|jgi:tripartite ATP-independent transporter DctP family solute receptor|uniref:TRAP transporter substrate-binding protein n=1 Tax=Sporomusa sp. TaxID=2078658 RepID=UPI002C3A03EB|nr:TRAP transporter substrate-binding protein [Sporomusa sp.]HWR05766.1 TRAP transporter substrate-binding protein [Sporomusa sp.]
MNTKKILVAALSVVVTASMLLTGCGQNDSKQADAKKDGATYKFRLAESNPAEHPVTLGDKKFAELVAARSNGRITIEVFPGAQLGEEKAVLEQVQLGAIEFTRVSASPLGEFNKQMSVFSLPYIFDNEDHMWKFLKGEMGEKMLNDLQPSRMKGLSYYTGGARSFYSVKPLTSIDSLKGLKIRVMQNKINMEMVAALGGSATPMPAGEIFSALQTGVIDGAENNYPTFVAQNHYQSAKHYIIDAHQRIPEVLLISKVAWDKLTPEDQKLIKQAALDSVDYQREVWAKTEKEAEAKVRAAGVTITEVKDLKPWQAAVKPVIDKYGTDFKEVLDGIDKARK